MTGREQLWEGRGRRRGQQGQLGAWKNHRQRRKKKEKERKRGNVEKNVSVNVRAKPAGRGKIDEGEA